MDELASAVRRTLYARGPLRRALLDTSVLTTDIIAATKRSDPSSFVAGARAATVRCLIPVHVWEEVPRVLADRHREGGRFDLGRALEMWQSQYVPVLYVVDAAGLPMTPEAKILAERDVSDVPMLLLAGVIAPVVIIGTDKDLVASGLASKDWIALRSALGDVGVTEGEMADLERAFSVVARVTSHVIEAVVKQLSDRKQLMIAGAVLAMLGGAALWQHRRKGPRASPQWKSATSTLLEQVSTKTAARVARHRRGEDRWQQAELGTPGDTLLHRVARAVVASPSLSALGETSRSAGLA
ncbi:PIN domain-containing protein [Streptomyces sp. NPDC005784]|uniref:PIN domain-containing protein n=1 Tax=Streptomyces sp. NPDC005784 TaxID=3364731 RepID=UPI0036CC834B